MNANDTTRLWTNTLATMALAGAVFGSPTVASAAGYVEGRLLVKTAAGLSQVEMTRLLKANMSRVAMPIGNDGLYALAVPHGFESALAAHLAKDPRIGFAEVERFAAPAMTPNDTYYSYAWHLPKIQAPSAWDFSQGDGVTVAVVDSGIDPTHPDLVAHLVPGHNMVSDNTDTSDVSGHGTLIAGVIGADTNNGVGTAGVGWNVNLMPVRVSETAGNDTTTGTIAAGIIWAADHGARIANVSYEVNDSGTVTAAAQYMRSLGGVVIIPSGNTGAYAGIDNPDLITVAATDAADAVPAWSSYGELVDLAAPGAGIVTTTNGGSYMSTSGTSFAAPVVAGVAALMLSANPNLTSAAIEQILKATALDIGTAGKDQYSGAGRIDAAAAVQMALTWTPVAVDTQVPSVAIGSPTANAQVSGTLSVQITASDNVGVTSVKLYAGSTLIGSDTAAPYAINLNTTAYANGALQLTARAYDAAGNEALSAAVTVTVNNVAQDTTAPTATITAPTANKTVSGTVTVKSIAADNVAVATMTLYVDSVKLCTGNSTALNCAWNAAAATRGTHVIKLTAIDTSGNAKTTSVSVKR
ncbi:S8 family serine peptidase [uncultured Thiodictyon sp.]|jgi:hypothetical protein|uniref:S8 family serine peptidase n=1 Tax=uncultured Thiodictyon sp. TaxID=1846217 RepID=UPI0025D5E556|nr:S8 family serine peptidase [uncultured Thiodictyon sp.]